MRSLPLVLSALLLAACDGGGPAVEPGMPAGDGGAPAEVGPPRGAAIDGSEDPDREAPPPVSADGAGAAEPAADAVPPAGSGAADAADPGTARRYDEYLANMRGATSLDPEVARRAVATAPSWFREEARRRGEFEEHWPTWEAEAAREAVAGPVTTEALLARDHLTFGDLALGDEALDRLLDVLLALDEFPTEPFEFPEAVKGLDGKEVTILGYMIPTQWKDSSISAFMLVGDLLACCFGGTPQPDAWIDVVMEGDGTKYLPYTPVLVSGTFHISDEMPESGYFVGVYRLDGKRVVRQD